MTDTERRINIAQDNAQDSKLQKVCQLADIIIQIVLRHINAEPFTHTGDDRADQLAGTVRFRHRHRGIIENKSYKNDQ